MSFGAQAWLWLLALVPAALAVLGWAVVWRSNARRRFGAREDGSPKWPAYVAPVLLVGAIAMAAFAAARPQIGDKDVRTEDKGRPTEPRTGWSPRLSLVLFVRSLSLLLN